MCELGWMKFRKHYHLKCFFMLKIISRKREAFKPLCCRVPRLKNFQSQPHNLMKSVDANVCY